MAFICALCIISIMSCLVSLVVGFTSRALINIVIKVLDNIKLR